MRRPWLIPILLSLFLLAPANAAGLIGKAEVRSAGRDAAKQVEKEEGLYPHVAAQERVQRIGNKLARKAKYQEGTVYAFQVLDMKDVNAFALPSGHIYVTSALLDKVGDNDDLLAAVIGHEIGHLSELHSFRRVERTLKSQLTVGFLGAIFGKKLRKTGSIALLVANQLFQAEYSQDQEVEADQYGVVLAIEAGFNPAGMGDFLTILSEGEKSNDILDYLQSHPNSKDRVKYVTTFEEELKGGKHNVADYTLPAPPEEAFEYAYPDFAKMEAEAKSREEKRAERKKAHDEAEPTERTNQPVL